MSDDADDDIEAQKAEPAHQNKKSNNAALLPILIIPGFMSSGLEVEESAPSPSWVGKRVWINLSTLGFESLHTGSALVENEQKKKKISENDENNDDIAFSEELHQEYEEQLRCKSRWIQHMSLSSNDMTTERTGIRVRAIPGLKGVDYLTPGALTNHVSYVFGPVIRALQQQAGYVKGHNLDAAPYDWRLPPAELERRDGYFTAVMAKVEALYANNDNTPVVLVCHSLGCRTAHYFLNFVRLKKKNGGQAWLDQHIHTYLPVGAPHLGAPKALRAMIAGDKMGLDAFLTNEEGLVLGRSFGSGAWLLPSSHTTTTTTTTLPTAVKRREGVLQISVSAIDCTRFLKARKEDPSHSKFRLVLVLNKKKTLTTEYRTLPDGNSRVLTFAEVFEFALPAEQTPAVGTIEIRLQERGLPKKEKKLRAGLYYSFLCWPLRFILAFISCIIKYTILLPFTLACRLARSILGITSWTVKKTLSAAGAYTTLASTPRLKVQDLVGNDGGEVTVTLVHSQEYQSQARCSSQGKPRKTSIRLNVLWTLPDDDMFADTPMTVPSQSGPLVFYGRKGKSNYRPIHSNELLRQEGFETALDLLKDCYDADKIGPRTTSSVDAPPVKRVKAVYGINLPTEVGAVYRRANLIPRSDVVQGLHELDTSVRLSANPGYKVKDGIIYENKSTPQTILESHEIVHRSGDGTVPYCSLQHCRTWQGTCDVTVDEIEGADHREILADKRFHSILVDYVTQQV